MPDVTHFYLDDSGTRNPDHDPGRRPAHGHDWFALGGVMIRQEDEQQARDAHAAFKESWRFDGPLRSANIRSRSENFAWLGKLEQKEQERFYEELYQLMAKMPVIAHACVIDRPGYNSRYLELYGRQRWSLCKTAFSVAIERAAKLARHDGRKLKVFVEKGDKKTDKVVKDYYNDLRQNGMPFAAAKSAPYQPLNSNEFSETLYEFRTKQKTSPIMQMADLFLWPICIGGYDPNNRPYVRLKEDNKLIDCHLSQAEIPALGIKYSCWELVNKQA